MQQHLARGISQQFVRCGSKRRAIPRIKWQILSAQIGIAVAKAEF
jgi:hypothetical protein